MASHPTDGWFDPGDGRKHKTAKENDIRRAGMHATPETSHIRKEVTRATSTAKTGPKPKAVERKILPQPQVTHSPRHTISKPKRPTQTNLPPRPEKKSFPNDMAGLDFPKANPNTDALAVLNKLRNSTSEDINTPVVDNILGSGDDKLFVKRTSLTTQADALTYTLEESGPLHPQRLPEQPKRRMTIMKQITC